MEGKKSKKLGESIHTFSSLFSNTYKMCDTVFLKACLSAWVVHIYKSGEEMCSGQERGLCDYISDQAHRPPVLKRTYHFILLS